MFKKLSSLLSIDMAIDLGTANSLVYVKDRGIIINEPSVVAVNNKTGQILAIGEEAKKMVGRTPAYISATRPLVNGVISDFEVTEQMLKYFIEKAAASGKKIFGLGFMPRVIIGIPCGVTEVERKAVRDAAKNAGARTVFLIEEPLASAIGTKLPIQEAGGNFIVDIGGGTTEVAIISLGGIVAFKSLRIAGDKLNDDIVQFAQKEYKLMIGERTAELIKMNIGSAMPLKEKKEMPMRGRNLVTGLPEEVVIFNDDVQRALDKVALLKRDPCVDCGGYFPPTAMDFDHVRGEKIATVSYLIAKKRPWEMILQEISKCELVCANCHRTRTNIRRSISEAA